jgi:hypothetical protein
MQWKVCGLTSELGEARVEVDALANVTLGMQNGKAEGG